MLWKIRIDQAESKIGRAEILPTAVAYRVCQGPDGAVPRKRFKRQVVQLTINGKAGHQAGCDGFQISLDSGYLAAEKKVFLGFAAELFVDDQGSVDV